MKKKRFEQGKGPGLGVTKSAILTKMVKVYPSSLSQPQLINYIQDKYGHRERANIRDTHIKPLRNLFSIEEKKNKVRYFTLKDDINTYQKVGKNILIYHQTNDIYAFLESKYHQKMLPQFFFYLMKNIHGNDIFSLTNQEDLFSEWIKMTSNQNFYVKYSPRFLDLLVNERITKETFCIWEEIQTQIIYDKYGEYESVTHLFPQHLGLFCLWEDIIKYNKKPLDCFRKYLKITPFDYNEYLKLISKFNPPK